MRLTALQAAPLRRLPLDRLGFTEPLPLTAPAIAAVRITGSRVTGGKKDGKRQGGMLTLEWGP